MYKHILIATDGSDLAAKAVTTGLALASPWLISRWLHGTTAPENSLLALMAAVSAGDHLLVTDSAYRPTRIFCDGFLKRFGVETTYYEPTIGAGITELMRDNTTAVLTEAPGSQSFEMQEIGRAHV